MLFLGLGGVVLGDAGSSRKLGMISHGIALVLLLVAGFGMQAKLQIGFPGWLIAKVVLWLFFGAMPVLAKKGVLKPTAAWALAVVFGAAAVLLGVTKPF